MNGDEGEADLDVQVSGMVAPKATIDLVVSEDTRTAVGIDLSAFYIIDNNIAPVMSESFGACEASLGTSANQFYNGLWEQAAAQGITVTIATGDPGAAGCDNFNTATAATLGLAVSGIASTPFNVAVGGTDFDDAGKQSNFLERQDWKHHWNTRVRAGLHSRNPMERFLRGNSYEFDTKHCLPKFERKSKQHCGWGRRGKHCLCQARMAERDYPERNCRGGQPSVSSRRIPLRQRRTAKPELLSTLPGGRCTSWQSTVVRNERLV